MAIYESNQHVSDESTIGISPSPKIEDKWKVFSIFHVFSHCPPINKAVKLFDILQSEDFYVVNKTLDNDDVIVYTIYQHFDAHDLAYFIFALAQEAQNTANNVAKEKVPPCFVCVPGGWQIRDINTGKLTGPIVKTI